MTTQTLTKTKWNLDLSHSQLSFKVKHLMISNVNGGFRKFTAEINGEDFASSQARVSIDVSSVFTNDEGRDGHLRGADFFDTENHKEISFISTSFQHINDDSYKLTGILTMKGISKPVTLDVEFGGISKDPWGKEKAGFSVSGKIIRKDWGLNWNAALEAGGVLVSDEVRISAEVQFVKQA